MSQKPPTTANSGRAILFAFITTAFVVSLSVLTIRWMQAPAAASESAAADQFSAGRAMVLLREIAQRPHPTGSEENARVREKILSTLRSMGIDAQVQTATAVREANEPWPNRPITAARVANIVARIPGTVDRKALMLSAHYDSVAFGPGASDDGAGVVTLLETARALKTGPPLRNDLILLFTDGEELGLLGAESFVKEHPWAKDVALVLNFEARGINGPVAMFETSEGNGGLIQVLKNEAPEPLANSLMYALYKQLPNDTDMTVFKKGGMAGLNFAFIGGLNHYHTALDTPDQIDPRSIQHHGSYALSLSRAFGNQNLTDLKSDDAIYFNTFGKHLVIYRQGLAKPLAFALIALVAITLFMGLLRKRLKLKGILIGIGLTLLAVSSAGVTAWLFLAGLRRTVSGFHVAAWGDPYNAPVFQLAVVLLAAAVTLAWYSILSRWSSDYCLQCGAQLVWLVLLIACAFLLPAASYVFQWPLLFSVAGLLLTLALRRDQSSETPTLPHFLIDTLSATAAIVIMAQVVYMLFLLVSLSIPAVQAGLVALTLCLLAPQLGYVARPFGRVMITLLMSTVVLVLCVYGSRTAPLDGTHKKVNSVMYALDQDSSKASWASFDATTDEWTGQFFNGVSGKGRVDEIYPWASGLALRNSAPLINLEAPDVSVTSDVVDQDGQRNLTARIRNGSGPAAMIVFSEPDSGIVSAKIDGMPLLADSSNGTARRSERPGSRMKVLFTGPAAEGFELSLKSGKAPLRLTVEAIYPGLPDLNALGLKSRTEEMMATPLSGASDVRIVRRTVIIN